MGKRYLEIRPPLFHRQAHMIRRIFPFSLLLFSLILLLCPSGFAQFSGSVTGEVQDPSGAAVPGATLTLTNDGTGETRTVTADPSGVYRFASLAPASYHLSCTAKGFSTANIAVTLQTNQVLNVPVKLAIGNIAQTVNVTTAAPVLDTADNRIQETIQTQTLSELPLAGRNMISLVTLAPGVTGTGVTSNGSPGSGRDNYSTETQVDSSANGQGAVGNMYIIDGLDVTSSIRPGVLNLTPNPDTLREVNIQTNTYTVDYGRGSSVQMTMTTKSGTDHYHGNVSDYFTNQQLTARTEFTSASGYAPFHSNNFSGTIGGPVVPGHRKFGYFFFGIEPDRGTSAVSRSITFEDPAFTNFAKINYPNSIGTKLLSTYPVGNISNPTVTQTAANVFPTGSDTACGTASTGFLPCGTPMIDSANYNSSQYRNGMQYFIRGDEAFKKERLYGTVYRTTLNSNTPTNRPAFLETNKYYEWAIQGSETHIFSPNTINEASFAGDRIEGISPATGLFTVPIVNVTGINAGFGSGFAQGDFIQHNYHWRDVFTHIYKSHSIQVGYEGLFGDDVELFAGPYDQPTFQFHNLLDLASDNVYTETGLAFDPLTGQHAQYNWNAAGVTNGAFIQDSWKATNRLTLNFGLRWDDFGNPWSRSANTAFSNFYYGPGQSLQEQIANGILIRHNHALNRSITDVFSPRGGVAWDIAGDGKWLVKGGAGFFHNWPTLANLQEQYRGNPPGDIFPTFYGGQSPAPILGFGTTNQQPFNFPAPTLPARSLNAAGGITGLQFNIGAVDPNLRSPVTYTYSAGLDHQMGSHYVAGIAFSGSNGRDLLSGGGQVYNVSYGQDINELPGDLIIHNSTVPQRLNPNFGQVQDTLNDRVSNYKALILSFQGRFSRSFFNASYTRSSSWDDTQVYPSYINVHQWYGPSNWNAPNRFSLAWNYQVPDVNNASGFLGRVGSGWIVSGTTILQSGNPFNVYTSASFAPTASGGVFTGYASSSGDYNADGDNNDYPNVASYHQGTSRQAFLHSVFAGGQFSAPTTFGSEGNERFNRFTGPNFEEWDASLLKNTPIHESVQFQLRFEAYNLFNRPNLTSMTTDLSNGNFGKATSQLVPRFFQIGGNLIF
jgi:hypothetical protein